MFLGRLRACSNEFKLGLQIPPNRYRREEFAQPTIYRNSGVGVVVIEKYLKYNSLKTYLKKEETDVATCSAEIKTQREKKKNDALKFNEYDNEENLTLRIVFYI
ncbi:hypothetical protein CDAR_490251 [Caerostris darwini]|uniref:Uncharacterized protein n=1 Tax=Caerostris darwini TaxID=1538125 RepID=A0AAV4VBD0_9ARAC|nr:hypothetical protein CDAR_490251 [Caerostris darwini]